MVPAPLGLPCRKRPPAFRSPPSGRDAVATLVPAASPAGRTGKHGFRSRTGCLTLRPNYLIDSMSVTTPAATVSAHPPRRFLPYLWPGGQRRPNARVLPSTMLLWRARARQFTLPFSYNRHTATRAPHLDTREGISVALPP